MAEKRGQQHLPSMVSAMLHWMPCVKVSATWQVQVSVSLPRSLFWTWQTAPWSLISLPLDEGTE